jgi:hypothetical protein
MDSIIDKKFNKNEFLKYCKQMARIAYNKSIIISKKKNKEKS